MFTRNSIVRSAAGGLVLAGLALPGAATAAFVNPEGGTIGATAALHRGQPTALLPVTAPAQGKPQGVVRLQPAAGAQPSFQWGDAGIGAGGATVLLGAAALGASASRRRRRTIIG